MDDFVMDNLPIEISTDILSRLPVKYVLRCKLVCKSWRSLIDDNPLLPMVHLTSSASQIDNPSSFMFHPLGYGADHIYIVEDSNKALPSFKSSKLNLATKLCEYYSLDFVGSCNGLVCFKTFDGHIHVYNPITLEYVTLPRHSPISKFQISTGFGFDPSTKVFKVVQIFQSVSDIQSETRIYTLGSNSWRKVTDDVPVNFKLVLGSSIFVGGSIHWLVSTWNDNYRIVSFDVGCERFGVVPNPEFEFPSTLGIEIGVLRGCLCLSDYSSFEDRFEIWIMEDYNLRASWTKQFDLRLRKHPMDTKNILRVRPICILENDELVLHANDGVVVFYNIESGKVTKFEDEILPNSCFKYRTQVFPYVGTLISPEGCKIASNLQEKKMHRPRKKRGRDFSFV